MDTLVALIREAITAWAQQVYATEAVFVGQIAHEEALEDTVPSITWWIWLSGRSAAGWCWRCGPPPAGA